MILRTEGDINRYYAQTLCMIFFPGATFGEDEELALEALVDAVKSGLGE